MCPPQAGTSSHLQSTWALPVTSWLGSVTSSCLSSLIYKQERMPWPVWLSWSVIPYTKRLQVQFLVRAHTWVAGSIPSPGAYDPQFWHIGEAANQCFSPTSLFLSFSIFLKSNEKCSQVRVEKKGQDPPCRVVGNKQVQHKARLGQEPSKGSNSCLILFTALWLQESKPNSCFLLQEALPTF